MARTQARTAPDRRDHALVRSGLRSMLQREPGIRVVGEARNGREAVALCCFLGPNLVLMDVRMPEMDGLEATHAIKHECPETDVLLLPLRGGPARTYNTGRGP